MSNKTKQVIVLRRFPGLRTGKYASQAAHASMAFLTKNLDSHAFESVGTEYTLFVEDYSRAAEIDDWLNNSFRKIVCYVDSEEELVALHEKALAAGLESHLIEDNGATEFKGVKTKTAVAIGPHEESRFEGMTNHLKLL